MLAISEDLMEAVKPSKSFLNCLKGLFHNDMTMDQTTEF